MWRDVTTTHGVAPPTAGRYSARRHPGPSTLPKIGRNWKAVRGENMTTENGGARRSQPIARNSPARVWRAKTTGTRTLQPPSQGPNDMLPSGGDRKDPGTACVSGEEDRSKKHPSPAPHLHETIRVGRCTAPHAGSFVTTRPARSTPSICHCQSDADADDPPAGSTRHRQRWEALDKAQSKRV